MPRLSHRRPRTAPPALPAPAPALLGLAVLAHGAVWAGEAGAQGRPIPEIRLQEGQELRLPFSSVQAMAELPSGDYVVADLLEQVLYRLNPGGTRKSPLGRNGRRQGEYLVPTQLMELAADSLLLYDGAQNRYLVISPDGYIVQTFQLRGEGTELAGQTPTGADRAGGIYFRVDLAPPPEASGSRAAILRYDRRNARVSAVMEIVSPSQPPAGDGPAPELPEPDPYLPEDAWGIALDGRVAVARVFEDQILWFGPQGTLMMGPPLMSDPRRVRVPDMRRWLSVWKEQRLKEGYPSDQVNGWRIDDVDWPVAIPPFRGGQMPVDRFGNLWLLRSHPGDVETYYDVVDGQGLVRARVYLPPNTRLQAFGDGAIFLTRRDALGLEWIQRFPWPSGSGRG